MPRSIKMIATTAALLLVVGVAPAYADDDTTDTTEAPDVEVIEEDGEESEGSHVNGKALVLFGKGFDFSKGSALGELIYAFSESAGGVEFDWAAFDDWLLLLEGEQAESFAGLSEGQLALLQNPPRNFGQLVSALRKHHGRDEHSPVYAAADGETKKGRKPDHAGTDGDDGDDGDTFDTGDEFSGKDHKSDRPGKGKKPNRGNKGGKKHNG